MDYKSEIMIFSKDSDEPVAEGFLAKEFDCPCTDKNCSYTLISKDLVYRLDECRAKVGRIKINSGFRCGPHNQSVGGKEHSFHLLGMAADIRPLKMDLNTLLQAAEEEFVDGGLGEYSDRIHVDCRNGKVRWKD